MTTAPPALSDGPSDAAFESWWRASKYCQVVIPRESWRPIALDGYRAGYAAAIAPAHGHGLTHDQVAALWAQVDEDKTTREYWIKQLAKSASEVRVSRAVDFLVSQSRKIVNLHAARAALAPPREPTQLTEAISLLRDWCKQIDEVGTGWDDWDSCYKSATRWLERYDAAPAPAAEAAPALSDAVFQDDLAEILRAVGLSDAARPYSPHEVVQRDLLPHLRGSYAALAPPREPTQAMVDAAEFVDRSLLPGAFKRAVWRAMYDAAPAPAAEPVATLGGSLLREPISLNERESKPELTMSVYKNGVRMTDQEQGIREFKEACRVKDVAAAAAPDALVALDARATTFLLMRMRERAEHANQSGGAREDWKIAADAIEARDREIARLTNERDALAAAMPSDGADAALAYAAEHTRAEQSEARTEAALALLDCRGVHGDSHYCTRCDNSIGRAALERKP